MPRLTKQERQKQFRNAAYRRAYNCNYLCQICGKSIHLINKWYTGDIWADCNYFDHIRGRSHLDDWHYINYFLFIHKETHFHRHQNKGWEDHECTKYFLENYFNGYKKFYDLFLESKGLEALYLI